MEVGLVWCFEGSGWDEVDRVVTILDHMALIPK